MYNNTKIRAINFVTNLAYIHLNEINHENMYFMVYVFAHIVQNLNLFCLDRKFQNSQYRKMVHLIWEKSVPNTFYKNICQKENSVFLNALEATHFETEEIKNKYATAGNFVLL